MPRAAINYSFPRVSGFGLINRMRPDLDTTNTSDCERGSITICPRPVSLFESVNPSNGTCQWRLLCPMIICFCALSCWCDQISITLLWFLVQERRQKARSNSRKEFPTSMWKEISIKTANRAGTSKSPLLACSSTAPLFSNCFLFSVCKGERWDSECEFTTMAVRLVVK